MGYSRWDSTSWDTYATKTSTAPKSAIFRSTAMVNECNPLNVALREARDSDANPESTPIIVAADVTGSMGVLAEHIVRSGLGTLFTELLDRKPVTDPQLMAMAIGDVWSDTAPLQISQFEADLKAASWLERLYLEGGGGGNDYESYDLPYYFAAYHTAHDAFEKRGKKGYLFTLGDECAPRVVTKHSIAKFINDVDGDGVQSDIPFKDVYEAASKMYHCHHIIIGQGSYARSHKDKVLASWREAMGQNVIWLDDYTKLSETIVSIIEVINGADKAAVSSSWGGSTAVVVASAIKDLSVPDIDYDRAMDVVRL